MSPEQARGQPVDARTDIWSLGVLLYEMIAGRSPFSSPSGSDVLAAILQNEPAPVARFEPDAPPKCSASSRRRCGRTARSGIKAVQDLLLDLQALRDYFQSHARAGSAPVTAIGTEPADSGSGQTPSSIAAGALRVARHRHRRARARDGAGGVGMAKGTPEPMPTAPSASVQRNLTRLTFDPGLQMDVTWSPDGTRIAYASDRSGNFDIWTQPVGGG